jgi:uncharacterized protein (DUF433 family)
VKTKSIEIVSRGRAPQLSTNRVTVQDLVPYFQDSCTHEEILRWMPTLTPDELVVVERYYREHQTELDEEDKKIRAYVAEQIRLQRHRYSVETSDVRLDRMKARLAQRQKERNGEGHPGRQ